MPFIASIASMDSHPDRVEAISFLRQAAIGSGVWSEEVRQAVERYATSLLAVFEREPEMVQRAILLLASAFPDLVAAHPRLVDGVPDDLRLAWGELITAGGFPAGLDLGDDSAMDRQEELERWALSGWRESG